LKPDQTCVKHHS